MKIKAIDQSTVTQAEKQLFDTYLELLDMYGKVFIYQLDGESFIYKPIGRKDFIDIFTNEQLSSYEKEEIVCETCVLYPENYNFSECANGGLPTLLSKNILESSYVTDESQLQGMMNYFREEMKGIQNQINCMIHEAFPDLSYETIENFDMETALKYLSRAEWILVNLRNMELNYDPFSGKPWEETINEPAPQQQQQSASNNNTNIAPQQYEPQPAMEKAQQDENEYIDFRAGETIEERLERMKTHKIKKEVLTSEKLAKLQNIAPEINWTYQNKEEDFKVDTSRI